ncbi:hypothetical protein Kpol_2001p39 [Vanderwaltozyma polyspora DSM 70294]|uniref:Yeast cell wall synthesis Kre9/Knh1 C-terminal domain-containing protein n=1 Tax=Vanderwaltozyma polyspora (strain ATCC 22028 / DSM 70294 / BCRC 21397 / CBS 2163 / NBRC 10782 / NRRL Y-8283 / UCD 57-17) TaxID=436907 RepID=A7TGS1_VANPO|nr:uncharacterized protein Kpol_2001p39 [Vanderwaltozyma polyspora DSM 70294]EDO18534.1 hypothetical protein Kpol_2001p39 [Vanderwaltozyma polyspora DSM 70294]
MRSLYLIFCFLLSFAVADVGLFQPAANAQFQPDSNGQVSIEISWIDNLAYPYMSNFTSFTFTLNNGNNTDILKVKTLDDKITPDQLTVKSEGRFPKYSYTVTFDKSITGNGQFFIQVYGLVPGQGNTIHYTHRFYLAGMSGVNTVTYIGTTEPIPQTSIVTMTTSVATINSASFTVPYAQQTGISRFAPMQTPPVSKVTATSWSRRFATSAVTYFTTAIHSLQQETTITEGWSGVFTSDYNYATPADFPSNNGGWYAPSSRLSLSARKVNYRKV